MLQDLQKELQLINNELIKYNFGEKPSELYDPIRYILDIGGKRMRPLLAVLSYKLFKDDIEKIIKPALAVEVFHNFTLMHDDIMDKAPLRRGMQTVHEKWNANIAILSGDVMLVKAYDILLSVDNELFKSAIEKFNTCAREVCEGQQLDMNFEKRDDVSIDDYLSMIRLKTAVLLGFSMELGGLIAHTDPHNLQLLKEIGTNIGIGFQLKDDLLDVYGDQEKFGKQVGGDIMSNKKTFLLLKALETAQGNQLTELKKLLEFSGPGKVQKITAIYDVLNIKAITQKLAAEYFSKGFEKLALLKAEPVRIKALKQFFETLISRES